MLKKLLKCIALIFIYIALNSISFSLLPFSEDFKNQNMDKGPSSLTLCIDKYLLDYIYYGLYI